MTNKESNNNRKYTGRFQLIIDTDSIIISQAPGTSQSRVVLANLQHNQLEQIIRGIEHAGLTNHVHQKLTEVIYSEPIQRFFYTIYLGLDQDLTDSLKAEIAAMAQNYAEGFTIIPATGFYRKQEEKTILIQMGVTDSTKAYEFADELCRHYGQDAVGVVESSDYCRVLNSDYARDDRNG